MNEEKSYIPSLTLDPQPAAAAPQGDVTAEAPKAEEKPPVSDDDWDILERIFSKKR